MTVHAVAPVQLPKGFDKNEAENLLSDAFDLFMLLEAASRGIDSSTHGYEQALRTLSRCGCDKVQALQTMMFGPGYLASVGEAGR